MDEKEKEQIREHWNKEAQKVREFDKIFPLGYAGTYPDYNMQHLEMNAILKYLEDGMEVLDIGCGKGYCALFMAWKKNIKITGLDYAEEMVNEANSNLEKIKDKLKGESDFVEGDVMDPEKLPDKQYDVVYTERCLINITDREKQLEAIKNISKLVKPGGMFVMQEGSETAMKNLNEIRQQYGLEPIKVVWHNKFFDDDDLVESTKEYFEIEKIDNFSSMFTLISRVINPALVHPEEPTYEAKINSLSMNLPNFGDYGYQKIYAFRKK